MANKRQLPPELTIKLVKPSSKRGKHDSYEMLSYSAELLFRHVFGYDKYYGTAGSFNDPSYFKKQIKKMITQLRKDIDNLQASELYINSAKNDLERLEKAMLDGQFTKQWQQLALAALRPIVTFLGYGAGSKQKTVEPYFIPSVWQENQGWNDGSAHFDHIKRLKEDYRIQIVNQLQKQGLTHAEIAEVMNQSGYRIAQLLNQAKVSEGKKK